MKPWIPVVLTAVFLFSGCAKENEQRQPFYPETMDGVEYFPMTDHTRAHLYSGHWEAPSLDGKTRKTSRRISKKSGTLRFTSRKREKYILDAEFSSPGTPVSIFLNQSEMTLKGSKKFIGSDKIAKGPNSLTFLQQEGLVFHRVSIYPKRILRVREYEKLIKDPRVLFLPGSLRFYIRPEKGEQIRMTLNLQGPEETTAEIVLRAGDKVERREKRIKSGKYFGFSLIKDEFQEVTISFPGLTKGYLKIAASHIIRRHSPGRGSPEGTEKIRELVKGKNLLLILLDAARNDRTGYSGYTRDTTPNIDRFSEGSLIFSHCYAEASYTLASTGTLLTGLPPDFHGVISSFFSSLHKNVTTLAQLFKRKKYFTAAVSANPNFGRAYKFHKGFMKFIELFLQHPAVQAGEFLAPFDDLLNQTGDHPFFIYLHLREPHDPFEMPPPWFTKFQNEYPAAGKQVPSIFRASNRAYADRKNIGDILGKLYDGNLAYGDMVFGELLKILDKRGLSDDTVVVFLSDHGESIGEHGVFGHGHVLYQQSIRIPMVLKIPGMEGGRSEKQMITSDLVRTLTDIFELPFPFPRTSLGRNVFDHSGGRRLVIRSINAFHYPGYAVIQYPFKLITHFPFDKDTMELFNLEKDPGELHPLKGKPLIRKTLLFTLFNHLRSASGVKREIANPELREKDLKALESLGYL